MATPDAPVLGTSERSMRAWRVPHVGHRIVSLGAVVVGASLVLTGTKVLTHTTAWPRVVLAVVGVWVAWRGIDIFCRARWGSTFPTGLWAAAIWVAILVVLVVFANLLPLQR